jgi:hypothetical protein
MRTLRGSLPRDEYLAKLQAETAERWAAWVRANDVAVNVAADWLTKAQEAAAEAAQDSIGDGEGEAMAHKVYMQVMASFQRKYDRAIRGHRVVGRVM